MSALGNSAPLLHPHDFISFSPKIKRSRISEFRSLYESGQSLRQISDQLGIPKSTVRAALSAAGISFRNFKGTDGKKLVVDPREYKNVQTMARL